MENKTELIVMLTYQDRTVPNAFEVFEQCKDTPVKFWGIKEVGLSIDKMKQLFDYMKSCGKITVLEVVAYTEDECMSGAKIAVECGCDILMGTNFFDSVNDFCKKNHLKYMPYIGKVTGRPSVLQGEAEDMLLQAQSYIEKGVYGINLLGYRYVGNANELNKTISEKIKAPLCLAGSVNSYERLSEVKAVSPWAFTIGSAFFENCFGETINEQIIKVLNYIE